MVRLGGGLSNKTEAYRDRHCLFIHLAAVLARTWRATTMLWVVARIDRVAVNCRGETYPVRSRANARHRAVRIEHSRCECRWCRQRAAFRKRATRSSIRFRSRTMTQLVLSYKRETFLDDNPARIDGGYGRQVNHVEPSLIFSAAIGSGDHMLQRLGTDSSVGQRVRAVFDPVDTSCLLRSRA